MDSFVEMRKFLISNQELFSRIDKVELRQIEFEKKMIQIMLILIKSWKKFLTT